MGSVLNYTGGPVLFTPFTGQEATGAGSAALGANCPAVTPLQPYTWEKGTSADGSTIYIPVWK
jgi:hypothetical protein